MPPGVPAACNYRGWMWPDIARCRTTLAPNLAPSKPLSKANVPRIEHEAGPATAPTVSGRARDEQELQGCNAARPAATADRVLGVTPRP
jgi:hypothetical protein